MKSRFASSLDRKGNVVGLLKQLSSVMENPTVYRLWQAPFARAKFAPIVQCNELSRVRRVLDVGCGPGTNSPLFKDVDYLGLDINPDYIRQACSRFGPKFEVGDVCKYEADPENRFDFVLMNSLLHHISDEDSRRILRQLSRQLTEDGHIHILDLVLPEQPSLARTLALGDRGDYPRPLSAWRKIFSEFFMPVEVRPYSVGMAGLTMWNMVYFKGRARQTVDRSTDVEHDDAPVAAEVV